MALPRLNFQPVVDPYVSKPIEEFGSTIGVLRQDYDEAMADENRVRQAMASIQAAPFQEEYLQRANEELQQSLGQVAERGDYERQRSFIKQATNKYLSRAIPLKQAGEQYRQFAEQATKLGVDPRVLEYVKREEMKNPSVKEVDGYTFNTFDTSQYQRFLRPEPNITEELAQAASSVREEMENWQRLGLLEGKTKTNPFPNSIPVNIKGQKRYVDKDELNAMMSARLKDSDLRQYIENQKLLVSSEIEEDLFSDYVEMGLDPQEARLKAQQESEGFADAEVNNLINERKAPIADALGYDNIVESYTPFKLPKDDGMTASDAPVIKMGNATGVSVKTPKQFSNLREGKKELQEKIKELESQGISEGNPEYDQYNEILMDMNLQEERIYNNLEGLEEDDKRLLKFYKELDNSYLNEKYTDILNKTNPTKEDKEDLSDIKKVLNLRVDLDSKVEKALEKLPDLSINYTTYSATDVGEYKSRIGSYTQRAREDVQQGATGYSVLDVGQVEGQDLQNYISSLEEVELSDGRTYVPTGDTEVRFTNGGYHQGKLIMNAVIYGVSDDDQKLRRPIKTVPITGGNIDEGAFKEMNFEALQIAEATGNQQLWQEAAQGMYRLKHLPNGRTVGEISSVKNINLIPEGSSRSLYTDNNVGLKLSAVNENGNILIKGYRKRGDKYQEASDFIPVPISSQNELEYYLADIAQQVNPEQQYVRLFRTTQE